MIESKDGRVWFDSYSYDPKDALAIAKELERAAKEARLQQNFQVDDVVYVNNASGEIGLIDSIDGGQAYIRFYVDPELLKSPYGRDSRLFYSRHENKIMPYPLTQLTRLGHMVRSDAYAS